MFHFSKNFFNLFIKYYLSSWMYWYGSSNTLSNTASNTVFMFYPAWWVVFCLLHQVHCFWDFWNTSLSDSDTVSRSSVSTSNFPYSSLMLLHEYTLRWMVQNILWTIYNSLLPCLGQDHTKSIISSGMPPISPSSIMGLVFAGCSESNLMIWGLQVSFLTIHLLCNVLWAIAKYHGLQIWLPSQNKR